MLQFQIQHKRTIRLYECTCLLTLVTISQTVGHRIHETISPKWIVTLYRPTHHSPAIAK